MFKDGLYLSHGEGGRAIVMITEQAGTIVWIREFVNEEFALNVLEDELLSNHTRQSIEETIRGRKGLFIEDVVVPEDGYQEYAFRQYVFHKQ